MGLSSETDGLHTASGEIKNEQRFNPYPANVKNMVSS